MIGTLYIDANNLLWRCLHTQPELEPGRTQLGATKTLLRMLARFKRTVPQQLGWTEAKLVIAWDSENLVRQSWYPNYKKSPSRTSRNDLREDGNKQRMALKAFFVRLGLPQLSSAGWEADDVIGTLLQKREGEPAAIISNDKDMYQLLRNNVSIVRPLTGGAVEIVRSMTCLMELGINPNQMVDYKALVGDKSDNIPGALGVGPAKALKLIGAFGTAEAACCAAEAGAAWPTALGGKLKATLNLSSKDVRLAYKLCKINTDVELTEALPVKDFESAHNLAKSLGLVDYVDDSLCVLAI